MSISKHVVGHQFNDGPSVHIWTPNIKLAHLGYETDGRLKDFLSKLKPDSKTAYTLTNALGSEEGWGENANHDTFPEQWLLPKYKTFETDGHVFTQHVNRDPRLARGTVPLAMWNANMRRVELVMKLPINQNEDVLGKIERGEPVGVSMGTKVKGDICGWCGNFAKNRTEYCDHIRNDLGKWRNGKVCVMRNVDPIFFDISIVRVPADKTAYILKKVASDSSMEINTIPLSVLLGEAMYGEIKEAAFTGKSANIKKVSDIDKDVPGAAVMGVETLPDLYARFRKNVMPALRKSEPVFNRETLNEFGKSAPLVSSTLAAHGVILKPSEFQRMMLVRGTGSPGLADDMEDRGIRFDEHEPGHPLGDSEDLLHGHVDGDLAKGLIGNIMEKSYLRGGLAARSLGHEAVHGYGGCAGAGADNYLTNDTDIERMLSDRDNSDQAPLMAGLGGSYMDYTRRARALAMRVAGMAKMMLPEAKQVYIKIAALQDSSSFEPLGLSGVAMGGNITDLSRDMLATLQGRFDYRYSVKTASAALHNGHRFTWSDHPLFIEAAILNALL
jgi:hypothetical protein